MIEYIDWLARDTLRANPDKLFVFGDNAQRLGREGQAAVCRGELNTLGIATKWAPSMEPSAFFSDDDPTAWDIVHNGLQTVRIHLTAGRTIVVPRAGIDTGLSRMPERCPKLLAYINSVLFPTR